MRVRAVWGLGAGRPGLPPHRSCPGPIGLETSGDPGLAESREKAVGNFTYLVCPRSPKCPGY